MSWLFSRVLVEGFSAGTCSAGGPCARSSGSPMPQAFSSHGKMTGFSRLSRFGMTCEALTDSHGEGLLTWFRAGFRARTSPARAKGPESTGSEAGCGERWRGSLARFDRASCSWRTHQCSLFEGEFESLRTWPRWAMWDETGCWELGTPGHLTSEIGSGSSAGPAAMFPTPDTGMSPKGHGARGGKPGNGRQSGASLTAMAKHAMWPTPRASENDQGRGADAMSDGLSSWKAQGRGATLTTAVKQAMKPTGERAPRMVPTRRGDQLRLETSEEYWSRQPAPVASGEMWPTPRASAAGPDFAKLERSGTGISLATAVALNRMFPTPMASEARQGFQNRHNGKKGTQESLTTVIQGGKAEDVGGALNPVWVEWLMGWPLGWTDLRPLEMDRFRQWRRSHGGCCGEETLRWGDGETLRQ